MRGYDTRFPDAVEAVGLERRVRFHDLRHTCATHLVKGTWAPKLLERRLRLEEVRDWLGHADIGVTQRYAYLCSDGIRALVKTAATHSWTTAGPRRRRPRHDSNVRPPV